MEGGRALLIAGPGGRHTFGANEGIHMNCIRTWSPGPTFDIPALCYGTS